MPFDFKKEYKEFYMPKLWYEYLIFIAIVFREKIHSTGKIGQILGKHLFYGKIRFLMLLSLVLKLKSIDFSGLRGFRCYFYYYQSKKSIDSPDFCSF